MNEKQLQQAFIQFLAQKTGAKNQQELEAAIQQLGEEGLKQAYAEFMQMMQQQQVQAAKFGAKLNYIKSLRGQCPEGYEISYYKVGGTLCKKCMKKQEKMQDGGNMPDDPIEQFKCGKKTKKTKKKEEGGELNSTKNPKAFSKMALAKCGAKLKEACKGVKMKDGDKVEKKPKLEPKPKQKRLNPDSTKTLPGGKYPSYWTPQERMRWERNYGEEANGTTPESNNNKKKVSKHEGGGTPFTSPIQRAKAIQERGKSRRQAPARELPEVTVTATQPAIELPEVTVTAQRPRYYWYSDNGDGTYTRNEARSETERRVHALSDEYSAPDIVGIQSVDNTPKINPIQIGNIQGIAPESQPAKRSRWKKRYDRASRGRGFITFFTSPVRRTTRMLKRRGLYPEEE